MKIFANNSILKKIVIIFLLITSISFAKPEPVQAGWGGELMEPVCDLLVGLADGVMNVSHSILIGQETTIIKVNLNDSLTTIFRVAVTAIIFLAVLAAAAALTAGGALAVGAVTAAYTAETAGAFATAAIIANIVPIMVGATYFGVKAYSMDAFDHEIDLPLYSLSPERIFSNTIPLFDVNFFHPSAEPYKYEWIHKTSFDEKYKPVYDDSDLENLDFSNAEDVTSDEMKLKIIESDDVSISNKDLISKVLKLTKDGKTYIKYTYQQLGNKYDSYLYLGDDGKYHSRHSDAIDFSNAEDITTDEMKKELAALGKGTEDNITNIKRISDGDSTYIRFTVRRYTNIYISNGKSRRGVYSIWNRREIFIFARFSKCYC